LIRFKIEHVDATALTQAGYGATAIFLVKAWFQNCGEDDAENATRSAARARDASDYHRYFTDEFVITLCS
jgi:hypothetical protein